MARRKDESLINNRKQKKARKVMFAVAFLLTLLCIGTGSYVQELDTVQVGSVAEKRYVAEADAVDEVATNKLKDAAADSVAPIYKQDAAVEEESNAEVKELFQDLEQILANLKEGESFVVKAQEAPWKLPVVLSERELKAYQALEKSNRTLFQEDCLVTMNNLYTEGITADALEEGRQKANEAFAATAWNKGLKEMAGAVFDAAITPNLLPDEAAIEAAREEKRAEVADVMIRKNQKIVDEGEIITQEIYDRLVSLHLVGGADYKSSVLPLLGSFLLVVLLFVALYLFFAWGRGQFALKPNAFYDLCDYDTAAAADGWRGLFYADSPWAVCHADKPSGGAACSIGDEYAVLHHRLLHLQWGCAVSDVFPSGRHLRCIAHPENGKASADGLGGCGDGGGQLCGNVWGRAVF